MNLSTDYPFLIAAYLVGGFLLHNREVGKSAPFLPVRCATKGWAWYGIFSGLGVFLAFVVASKCGVSMLLAGIVLALPTLVRYFTCPSCGESYNVTLTYLGAIPLIYLLFDCTQITAIVTGIAIASAFGRIGCLCAGCCSGPKNDCTDWHYEYRDDKQQINEALGRATTCTKPSLLYETIYQFILAGLCLRFPRHAPVIFGIGTGLLVLCSVFYRYRAQGTLTAMVLMGTAFLCVSSTTIACVNDQPPAYVVSAIAGVIVAYVLSKNLFKKPLRGSDTDNSYLYT